MNRFTRILLVVLFAAGGAGLAVALVLNPAYLDDLASLLETVPATTVMSSPPAALPPLAAASPAPVAMVPHPPVAGQPSPPSYDRAMEIMAGIVKEATTALAQQSQEKRAAPPPKPADVDELPLPAASAKTPSAANGTTPPKTTSDRDPKTPPVSKGAGDNNLNILAQGEDLLRLLDLLAEQGDLNILASKSVTGTVNASVKNVSVEEALSAILKNSNYAWRREGSFIYVGTPAEFKQHDQNSDRLSLRVYHPNYVPARDLEAILTPLVTEGVGKVKATTPPQKNIAPDTNSSGGDDYAGNDAVIVRDYEAVLCVIDQLVASIDRRPTQVAIEAMILSVKLNDTNRLGVDFELLRDKPQVVLASGSPLSDLSAVEFNGGLKFGYLDGNVSAFLDALESVGEADIIATPRLMCVNRQRAEILIGSQLGYVSTTQTETSSTQNVEFLEVGTQLRLRPFISTDGQVRLEIHPELSTGQVRVEQNFTLPDKEVTQVTTNVIVRDGSTVIIGGLIRDELTNTINQIPFLGSLPLVGVAFRRTIEENERREILVLITPHIVYEPEMSQRGDKAAREFHHRHMQYADKLNPLGKRYLGRKMFHAAQQAWHAGNQQRALHLINLSIHFDPTRRAAIDLRSDIVDGRRRGDHTDVHPPRVGPGLHPLDSEMLAPWILDGLQGPPDGAPRSPRHPVDPGQPPAATDLRPLRPEEIPVIRQ
jgi:type IV pilus assembly protein PilQ